MNHAVVGGVRIRLVLAQKDRGILLTSDQVVRLVATIAYIASYCNFTHPLLPKSSTNKY